MRFRRINHQSRPTLIQRAVCAIAIVALSGCTILSPEPTPTPTPQPPTSTPIQPTVTPTPSPEPTPMFFTLKLWVPDELSPYGDAPGAQVLAQQISEFNQAHPELQVEVTVKKIHGRGGMLDYLRTAREVAPALLPDIVVLSADDLASTLNVGHIQPLDDLIPAGEVATQFPFAAELGTVEGQTAGFIIGADVQHLVYRSRLLNSPPISWTGVISPPVSYVFPAGGIDGQVNDATLIQYMAAGGKVTDAEGNPTLDRAPLVETLTFYSDCVGSGAISPAVVLDIADPAESWAYFKAGQDDMALVQASQYWRELLDEEMVLETHIASVPTRDGYPYTIVRDAWALAMATEDPERQALAATLLNWLIAPDRNAQWTRAAGYMPSTRNALRLWDIPDEERVALIGLLESSVPAPPPEVMTVVGPALQEAVEDVLRRRVDPRQAADQAIDRLAR